MKKQHKHKPARHRYTTLKQLCNLIPGHMVSSLAQKHGVDIQSRTYTPWSHVVSLLYAHFSHALGLNDVCDALQMNAAALSTIRGAVPPSRNNLSHANKIRNADMAEELYWCMMKHLMDTVPGFAKGKVRRGYLRRFSKTIHALDSTTIQLVANCMDWAKHRRRKAAAKCHLRLDLQSFLPRCAIIDTAKHHDSTMTQSLCAELKPGEIAVFDKAYNKFKHLFELTVRGVWWVGRAKDNMQYKVVRTLETTGHKRILRDEVIEMVVEASKKAYPCELRRVVALVEINGKDVEIAFITNHLEWSAWTVAELYRCRWDIEVFFKEIKQTLQLSDFLGYSANAVRWQIWMGLLVHLLMRCLAFMHGWEHSFKRQFTVVRAVLWRRWNLPALLDSYGTAKPPGRIRGAPEQAYLPGFV
ncbi:IS4 family transposase [Pontiella desulfatans]|uniref:IS4 family transposase n=1 Tax=Pontiella desulfatans TaxID=2750659 RepID=UPI00109CC8BF|nr:IS4 family transposase [Pontiella desulfatans]